MKPQIFTDVNGNEVKLNARELAYCKSLEAKFNEAIYANDVSGIGAQIDITTLTVLLKTVSTQKFYTVDVEKYLPVDTDGGWADRPACRHGHAFRPLSYHEV